MGIAGVTMYIWMLDIPHIHDLLAIQMTIRIGNGAWKGQKEDSFQSTKQLFY